VYLAYKRCLVGVKSKKGDKKQLRDGVLKSRYFKGEVTKRERKGVGGRARKERIVYYK